jgi:hypothetical protein
MNVYRDSDLFPQLSSLSYTCVCQEVSEDDHRHFPPSVIDYDQNMRTLGGKEIHRTKEKIIISELFLGHFNSHVKELLPKSSNIF